MLPACSSQSDDGAGQGAQQTASRATVTITTGDARHVFKVEVARTAQEQAQGLMFRTDIPEDGGMLFAPYPADGGPPRQASFWMRNTPTSLDILFIRADGSIATIIDSAVPNSDQQLLSGEPVAAVLEILGGRAAELGISPGDKVTW